MLGIILAGGENKRIPFLKSHIEINGKRILDSSIQLLKNFFDKIIISTNSPELYFYCGKPMIGDTLNERGPLTGILSVLLSTGDDIFVVACDMPFIKPELIRYIIDKYRIQNIELRSASGGPNSELKKWDAVIPMFDHMPQPLIGIYSKNITGIIERRIAQGLKNMRDMLTELNILYIKEEDVRKMDPEGRSFVNINTMEDLEKVKGGKICLA